MDWAHVVVVLIAASAALTGAYILSRDPRKPLYRAFALFASGMAVLAAGMALLFATHHFIFNAVVFVGGYAMTAGFVLLAWKFPEDRPLPEKSWRWFVPLAAIAAASPFGFVISGMVELPDGGLEPINGPGMPVFAALIGMYLGFGIWTLWRKYRILSGRPRLQMQYLGAGAGAFVAITFVSSVLLPAFGIFHFNLLGPVSSLIFVGAVAYAMVRHRLLDAKSAIQRGVIYAVLATTVIGFYLALVFAASTFFYRVLDESTAVLIAGAITVCAGILTVPFMEQYFRRATDHIFFKDSYEYAQALQELSAILSRHMETAKITARSERALRAIFKTAMARVLVFDHPARGVPLWYDDVRTLAQDHRVIVVTGEQGESPASLCGRLRRIHGIEVVVPVLKDRKAMGAVVLGSRRSGDSYRKEDFRLLDTFSHWAAVALEKARLFEQVRRHSDELEERVRERTMELEKMHEEQREMMIDISHRLQTPLATVKSELEFLKRGLGSAKHIEAFERSLNGISKFIYDLLSLARLGVGRSAIPKERLDLSALLKELAEYYEVMAEDRGISFETHIEPHLFVNGSREYLEELVTNLVSNAFKYMEPKREQRATIALTRDGDQAVMTIKDTGRGIARGDLDRIFERFYRGRQVGVALTSGTGLGLAIARRIVENHEGRIGIESEMGKGTEAKVSLPLATGSYSSASTVGGSTFS